jgi:hypothetical protein
MCHTQYKKHNIIWTLSSTFVQAHPADFCKNTSNEKSSNLLTDLYSLKYNKLNMPIGQLWSVVNFFVKNQSIILIRDAKFKKYKMNQKKNPSNSKFSTSFFSGGTENNINFYINTEKQKISRFRIMSTLI